MAQAVGSAKTAVSLGSPLTEKTWTSGTQAYSAKKPGSLTPNARAFSHRMGRPARQYWQYPQGTFVEVCRVEILDHQRTGDESGRQTGFRQ